MDNRDNKKIKKIIKAYVKSDKTEHVKKVN
jgi:hypothetical protein